MLFGCAVSCSKGPCCAARRPCSLWAFFRSRASCNYFSPVLRASSGLRLLPWALIAAPSGTPMASCWGMSCRLTSLECFRCWPLVQPEISSWHASSSSGGTQAPKRYAAARSDQDASLTPDKVRTHAEHMRAAPKPPTLALTTTAAATTTTTTTFFFSKYPQHPHPFVVNHVYVRRRNSRLSQSS